MQKYFNWIKTSADEFSELTENSTQNLNNILCWVCNRVHGYPNEIPDCYTSKFLKKFDFGVLSNKISLFYGSERFLNLFEHNGINDNILFGRIFDNKGRCIDGFKSFYPKNKIQLYGDEYNLTHCRNCNLPIIDYIRGKAKINTLLVPENVKILSPFSDYGIIVDTEIGLKVKEARLKHISISKIFALEKQKTINVDVFDFLSFDDLNALQFPVPR